MTSFVLNPIGRPLAWQAVFVIGIGGLVVAAIKAGWSTAPAVYQPPPSAAAVRQPATSSAFPTASMQGVSPIQAVAPASSFVTSRIAPAALPPGLAGLDRPPPDPPPIENPVGVQPGYVIPEGPQVRDIR